MKPLTQTTLEASLLPSLAYEKRSRNTAYLMELKNENLLFSFYTEAGLLGTMNYKPEGIHWGWDGPLSQIRGTFTGHWLSAAARTFNETKDYQLKAKADYIVAEIARCQEENGGGWAFPIPEKYLHSLKRGKHFWAPQYVCHKIMMGLLDMYTFAGNTRALEILEGCTEWFVTFTNDISRETMDMMMDIEETGGMMELWADLFAVTNDSRHLELMNRYLRPRLTEPILKGVDVLTNMHANTTIPEIHGCARAYEVTGEESYRKIVENYWDIAITQRKTFATGGQSSGEIWTAKGMQAARLGDMNQEHCVVYNLIRLAEYLYRWTGDTKYAGFIELNIWNGLFAQGHWQGNNRDMCKEPRDPDTGLVAYYLPLAAGSSKKWGSKTEDFWCCHCTLVQANARYREFIFYRQEDAVVVAQYLPCRLETEIKGQKISIEQTYTDLGGHNITITEVGRRYEKRPEFVSMSIKIVADTPVDFSLRLRIPSWVVGEPQLYLGGKRQATKVEGGYATLEANWKDEEVTLILPKALTCSHLPDDPNMVAFMDGPVVLAGLVDCERVLAGNVNDPTTMLKPYDERRWTSWNETYYTKGQDNGFYFKPIYDIGYEKYTVYFPVKEGDE